MNHKKIKEIFKNYGGYIHGYWELPDCEWDKVAEELLKLFNGNDNWVAIKDEMPPVHTYVILVTEDGYQKTEFINGYDLTTNKFPKNYTHWKYQDKLPKK